MVDIIETEVDGIRAVAIENEYLKLVTVPECGGKIYSILNKKNGFDFIFKNKRYPASPKKYGAVYQYSESGGDELFPCIAGQNYPDEPWRNVVLPAMGEVWTGNFKTDEIEGGVLQSFDGVQLPYSFKRKLQLLDNRIEYSYRVENKSSSDMKFIWSVQHHSVLYPGVTIEIAGSPDLYVDISVKSRFEEKKKFRWPVAVTEDREERDFSRIDSVDDGHGDKLFLTNFGARDVAVMYPNEKQKVRYSFEDPELSCCGIWIDRSAWPFEDPDQLLYVSPSNCLSDSLDKSSEMGSSSLVPAGRELSWGFEMAIENC